MEVYNIKSLLFNDSSNFYDDIVRNFKCKRNKEVQNFLIAKSKQFTKENLSVTYLMLDNNAVLCGYFTLTFKVITIKESFVNIASNKYKKIIKKFGKLDSGNYMIPAYLLAQIGRNDCYKNDISLFDKCLNKVLEIQYDLGGKILFLECENNKKLIKYYESKSFIIFSNINKNGFVQMLRII